MKTIYEKLQTKSITTTIVTAMTIMMSIAAIIMTTTSFDSPMLFDIGNINNHKAYAQINTIIGTTGDDTLSAPPGFNRIHGDTDASLNDYAQGGNDKLITATGGKESTYVLNGGGGKDLFVTGGNTDNILEIDYIEGEDTIAGALAKDYRTGTTTLTNSANEQQKTADILNAILLKGKTK